MEFDTNHMNYNMHEFDEEQEFDYENDGHESVNEEKDNQRDGNKAPEDVETFIGDSNNRDATLGNNANTLLAFVLF